MTQQDISNELAIIKGMIEKTRRETIESGELFIAIGLQWIIFGIGFFLLGRFQLAQFIWPGMIVGLIVTFIISLILGIRGEKKEKVKTYSRTIYAHLWMSVGAVCILVGFVFPLLNVFDFQLMPIIVWLVLGIGFYMTGVIFELRLIQWCSLIWWIVAILMVFVPGMGRFYLTMVSLLIGYVLPGLILNYQSKQRSRHHAA
ncbi:hypothetical protein JW960_03105 [candidate division KSB1 bacterium]|nr:hypothetical protein [candidate division KSB1 bacterium]